ncbi:MAG TPA: beta-L-arabinofuranosidase domain-containing protein [Chloroflexota bacterium]|nr:beta-L-arabinofuranosidase domain-containing protein [Chloroflexota bacterium]
MSRETHSSPFARLRPLPLGAVRLEGGFWGPRLETTRTTTLRQQYEACENTGRIDNFRRAAGKKQVPFQGRYYNDSDVYKWLEAASYALAAGPDAALERTVEELGEEIAAAQGPDGYLNTYFTFERAAERWTDLPRMHELYCAGHFMQAAVAHHQVTGRTRLLDVATRLADHIARTFGPGIRPGTCGHEEIELAMVALYRETGQRLYLERAQFFLDQRGQQPPVLGGSPYYQDHLPVRQQSEIVGHAVRATYLACGLADVYAETGEPALLGAAERLWQSAFTRKAYVTGALGARWEGEAFGSDFELPNERAYAETCAAIGGLMWNWRMLLISAEPRYADWMETALYNGILSGIGLNGTEYFYQNPLADRGEHRRRPWFGTACCPPNIARLLLGLPGYLYTTSPEGLWVHHYAAGTVRAGVGAAETVSLQVDTRYPWDGRIQLTIRELWGGAPEASPATWSLFLRLPGWCTSAALAVNGTPVADPALAGHPRDGAAYVELRRPWREGDTVTLHLEMPVRLLAGDPRVEATAGHLALARGPLVYCVEAADNPGRDVWGMSVSSQTRMAPIDAPHLLGGIVALQEERSGASGAEAPLSAIPYYAWANRTPGAMRVWLPAA